MWFIGLMNLRQYYFLFRCFRSLRKRFSCPFQAHRFTQTLTWPHFGPNQLKAVNYQRKKNIIPNTRLQLWLFGKWKCFDYTSNRLNAFYLYSNNRGCSCVVRLMVGMGVICFFIVHLKQDYRYNSTGNVQSFSNWSDYIHTCDGI